MRLTRRRLLSERVKVRVNRDVWNGQGRRHAHGLAEIVVQVGRLVEVDHWREVVLADGLAHRRMKDGIHQLDIQEIDFSLCRMYIDVDVGWVHLNIQEIPRETVLRNHLHEGILDGVMQVSMFDKTLIYKEILLSACLLGILCLDDIAFDTNTLSLLSNRQQFLLIIIPKQPHDALLEVAGIEMVDLLAVAGQCKAYLGVHQRDAGELFYDVTHLGLRRLEEVATSRHIVKQVFHRERCARLHRHKRLFLDYRTFVDNLHPHLVFLASCLQFHLSDGCDASQSLTTETHGADGKQVLRLADLGGGVPLKAQAGVGFRHATAIVDDHNHRLASVFHNQVNLGGASIQGVLHQLFDS